jgi:hypothetical protein
MRAAMFGAGGCRHAVSVRTAAGAMSREGSMNRFASLLCVLGVAGMVSGATASPIDDLVGYWTGAGSVTLANGNTERVKCAVTYKVTDGGNQIRQSMRCASTDYSINASADLKLKGQQVSGSWEEKTYSAVGQISGRYTGSSFVLSIQGANFSAALNVTLSNCKQSINITPQGLDVTKITIGLGKC